MEQDSGLEDKLRGTGTALATPFRNNGSVDYDGLKRNIEYQIKSGVNILVPLGSTGETPALHDEEQRKITEITVDQAGQADGVIVMAGASDSSTEMAAEKSRRAEDLGADMVMVSLPSYNKPPQEGIYQHFERIAEEVGIPVVAYNVPSRTGSNLETSTLERIAGIDGVIGIKEASGDLDQIKSAINRSPEYFSVMSGDDGMTLSILEEGGRGVISVVSNLVPQKVVEMVNYGLEGDFESAREVHDELEPLFEAAFLDSSSNPIPIKWMMNEAGLSAGGYRLPLTGDSLSYRDKKRMRRAIETVGKRINQASAMYR